MLLVAEDPSAIRLDPGLLKTLASDTRRDILRALKTRRMTVSELSKQLGVGKPTVLEHVRKLDQAGLVRRLEDERLWVYYELTEVGKRMIGQGSVSVFLMLGLTIAALAVGTILVLGVTQYLGDGFGTPDYTAQVETTHLYQGAGSELRVVVEGDEGVPAGAFRGTLMPVAGDAVAFYGLEGSLPPDDIRAAQPVALGGAHPSGDALGFDTERVPPGVYRLTLTDAEGHKVDSDGVVVMHQVQFATTSDVWWQGLDGPWSFQAWVDGIPAEGDLIIGWSGDAPMTEVPLQDGVHTFKVTTLDQVTAGQATLAFRPANATAPIQIDDPLEVRDPRIAVAPRTLVDDDPRVSIVFRGHTETPGATPVLVDGRPAHPDPAEPGLRTVALAPFVDQEASGLSRTLRLDVGRSHVANVTLLQPLDLALHIEDGPNHTLRVTDRDGLPVQVAVRLDGQPHGQTDVNGTLALGRLGHGVHTVGLVYGDDTVLHRRIQVSAGDVAPLGLDVRMSESAVEPDADGGSVRVRLENGAPEPAELTLLGLGEVAYTLAESVRAPPGQSEMRFEGAALPLTTQLVVTHPEAIDLRVVDDRTDDGGGSGGAGGGGAPTPSESPTAPATTTPSTTPTEIGYDAVRFRLQQTFGDIVTTAQVDPLEPTPTTDPAPGLGGGEDAAADEEPTPAPGLVVALFMVFLVAWGARRRGRH